MTPCRPPASSRPTWTTPCSAPAARWRRWPTPGWRVVLLTVFTRSVPNPAGFALRCQTDKGLPATADYMALRRAEDAAAGGRGRGRAGRRPLARPAGSAAPGVRVGRRAVRTRPIGRRGDDGHGDRRDRGGGRWCRRCVRPGRHRQPRRSRPRGPGGDGRPTGTGRQLARRAVPAPPVDAAGGHASGRHRRHLGPQARRVRGVRHAARLPVRRRAAHAGAAGRGAGTVSRPTPLRWPDRPLVGFFGPGT